MLPGWWFDDVFPHHFQVLNYLYLGVASMSRTPKNQPMSITPHGANKINQRSTGHCSRAGSNMTHLMVRYSEIEKKKHVWPGGRVRAKPLMKRMQTNL